MPTTLRLATPADAQAIAALVNRAYRPATQQRGWTHETDWVAGERISSEQVAALDGPRSCVLLLCRGPAIAACVHIEADGDCSYIGMLASEPGQQGQGLGKRMLAAAEAHAAEHFAAHSFRMVVLSARAELIAFYERRGYRRTGQLEPYPVAAGVGSPRQAGLTIETLIKPASHGPDMAHAIT